MRKIIQSILSFLTLADRKLGVRLNTETASICRKIYWYNYFLFLCIMHPTHYHFHYYATVHLTPVFVQFSTVAQSCLTLCNPMDCGKLGLLVHYQLPRFTQTHVHWVSDTIQPSHPLLPLFLLPSIFPSIRVFSDESVLRIRWPKYWSFSFSISLLLGWILNCIPWTF